jgi:hypothetical protein
MLASLLADLFELSDVILIEVADDPLPPVAGGVYLELFHGRADPAQDMADWGDAGPVFGPFEGVHTTYAADSKLVITGDNCGALTVVDDLVYYAGLYYGDWAVMGADQLTLDLQTRLQTFDQAQAVPPAPQPVTDSVSTEAAVRTAATRVWDDANLQVFDDARVQPDKGGYWVEARVWVSADEVTGATPTLTDLAHRG